MKNKIFSLMILVIISVMTANAQSQSAKKDPAGQWKFEAPYAPEGYTSGTVIVAFADKKYTATMSFTGSEYKFPGDRVLFEKDTLSFSIYIQGEDVAVSLKLDEPEKMSGKAVYSEGVVPISLTKMKEKK